MISHRRTYLRTINPSRKIKTAKKPKNPPHSSPQPDGIRVVELMLVALGVGELDRLSLGHGQLEGAPHGEGQLHGALLAKDLRLARQEGPRVRVERRHPAALQGRGQDLIVRRIRLGKDG